MKLSLFAMLALSGIFMTGAKAQSAAKEHNMTGCLQKGTEPNSFIMTDVEGKGPKMVGIVSSTANLAPHVGHKIEITGTTVNAKEAESDKNVSKAPHYMDVTAVKMISTSCP